MHHDEGKEDGPCCDNCGECGNCGEGCGCGGYSHGRGKLYFLIGVLAIVYGIINYLIVSVGWPGYQAWIVGGVLLLLVGWLKKHMMKY